MMHIEKDIFERTQEQFLQIKEWDTTYGVFAGFSTREGGVSQAPFSNLNLSYIVGDSDAAVKENRKILAAQTPVAYESWIFAEQKHTNHIMEVSRSDVGKGTESFASGIANTDGLYTYDAGIMLATFHASSSVVVPISLYLCEEC